jgi:hypothetical protein
LAFGLGGGEASWRELFADEAGAREGDAGEDGCDAEDLMGLPHLGHLTFTLAPARWSGTRNRASQEEQVRTKGMTASWLVREVLWPLLGPGNDNIVKARFLAVVRMANRK